MSDLEQAIEERMAQFSLSDNALGALRYEAVRRLTPPEFKYLWKNSMPKEFDERVDELIEKTK
jgi:hypothetical protein